MTLERLDPISVVCALFEKFIDYRTGISNKDNTVFGDLGLYSSLMIGCENLGYENDGETHHPEWIRRELFFAHIIILQRRKVYVAISNERLLQNVPLNEFKNTSNHDSCWRYGFSDIDKKINEIYEHCYLSQNPPIPKEHVPTITEANIVQKFDNTFGNDLRFVSVKYKNNETKENGDYILTEIKHLKAKLMLTED